MTPTHVIALTVPGFEFTPAAYPTKVLGAPSNASLADYVATFEASTLPGGANAHLGETHVAYAQIIRQSDSTVVAHYVPAA